MPRKTRAAAKAEEAAHTNDDAQDTMESPMELDQNGDDVATENVTAPTEQGTPEAPATAKKSKAKKKKNNKKKKAKDAVEADDPGAKEDDDQEDDNVETPAEEVAEPVLPPVVAADAAPEASPEETADEPDTKIEASTEEQDIAERMTTLSIGTDADNSNASQDTAAADIHGVETAPEVVHTIKETEITPVPVIDEAAQAEELEVSANDAALTQNDVQNHTDVIVDAETTHDTETAETHTEDAKAPQPDDSITQQPEGEEQAKVVEPNNEESKAAQEGSVTRTEASANEGRESADPIGAMDALDDALEEVDKALPAVASSPISPVKKSRISTVNGKGTSNLTKTAGAEKPSATKKPATSAKSTTSKPAAPKSTTVKPAAAKSSTSAPKPSVLSKSTTTRPSTTATKPAASASLSRSTMTRPRPSSVIAPKDTKSTGEKEKPTDYLASKRRPVSVSFPTPPPPPKSTKAPTKASFTLPGEAVAAKLKAAREERLKKEEEEAKKRKEFKARPVPSTVKAAAPAAAVKQTAASRARMSLAGGSSSDKENAPSSQTDSKRIAKPTTTTTSTTASKRLSTMGPPRQPSSTLSKRASTIGAPKPMSSTTNAPTSKPRISSLASSVSSLNSKPSGLARTNSTKGKEVFNRDRVDKEAKEKERKDAVDMKVQARKEADERSKQKAREFREKQAGKKVAEVGKGRKTPDSDPEVKKEAAPAVADDGGPVLPEIGTVSSVDAPPAVQAEADPVA